MSCVCCVCLRIYVLTSWFVVSVNQPGPARALDMSGQFDPAQSLLAEAARIEAATGQLTSLLLYVVCCYIRMDMYFIFDKCPNVFQLCLLYTNVLRIYECLLI